MFRAKQNNKELDILEKKYEKQLKDSPESSCFVILAEILLKQNKIEKAISVLLKGLRNNKNMVTARFLLGKAYYQSWKIDLALKELKKVIKMAPDNFAAGELLIKIFKSEKKYKEALGIAKDLSFYYKENAKLEKEVQELKLLASGDSNNQQQIDYIRSEFRSAQANTHKTKEDFFQTVTLADIYISQNQYDDALKIMESLVLKEPNNIAYREKYNSVLQLLSRKTIR